MDCYNERDAVILFCQGPPKMSVPRVTMHQVGIDVGSVEIDASPYCPESGAQWFRAGEIARVEFEANDLEVAFFQTLVAKTTHFHRHRLCQLARKITHVHTCTAVDVRRIFIREEKDLQATRVEQASGLLAMGSQARRMPLLRTHQQHRYIDRVANFVRSCSVKNVANQT